MDSELKQRIFTQKVWRWAVWRWTASSKEQYYNWNFSQGQHQNRKALWQKLFIIKYWQIIGTYGTLAQSKLSEETPKRTFPSIKQIEKFPKSWKRHCSWKQSIDNLTFYKQIIPFLKQKWWAHDDERRQGYQIRYYWFDFCHASSRTKYDIIIISCPLLEALNSDGRVFLITW